MCRQRHWYVTSTALGLRLYLSPQVVVDAVCSVASEEIQMDAWGIDVVLSASQKGLGTPPGLSILVVSQKALKVCSSPVSSPASNLPPIQVFESRSTPVRAYYASWNKFVFPFFLFRLSRLWF